MPLRYLLYRCPKCGEDPTQGHKDEVWCDTCGTRYERGDSGGLIGVLEADGTTWDVPSHRLTGTLASMGGPYTRGLSGGRGLSYLALVEVRRASDEEPVWHKGELLGFAEGLGPASEGVLHLTLDALSLWSPDSVPGPVGWVAGEEGPKGPPEAQWDLFEIRAVQTSSSSLQISPRGGGLIQFRFKEDSPRRWEDLLKGTLREAYEEAGLGRIVEFQPRIVAVGP